MWVKIFKTLLNQLIFMESKADAKSGSAKAKALDSSVHQIDWLDGVCNPVQNVSKACNFREDTFRQDMVDTEI